MSKNGFLTTACGMATAAAAHALFGYAMMAAQPAPAAYLARLAAPLHQPAADNPQLARERAAPSAQRNTSFELKRLNRGTITC